MDNFNSYYFHISVFFNFSLHFLELNYNLAFSEQMTRVFKLELCYCYRALGLALVTKKKLKVGAGLPSCAGTHNQLWHLLSNNAEVPSTPTEQPGTC